ncbi:hypothetical protein G9C98_006358 [Cotesia typhae]|uniref:Ig-like domain-containing protein n=1 Tax=Cotesia typhae TaxID=2053667 RepID=A0A8J5R430_9HYME|nr:hypothetical protein G9C98_006358 [Cotesia typhae]
MKLFNELCCSLVLLVLILGLEVHTLEKNSFFINCPDKCWCYHSSVRCMYQGITFVPRVPTNTTILDLRFNDIVDLQPGTFHGLKHMDTILLNDNKVKHLSANTFIGLPRLRILYLYKNYITSITPGAFSHLPNLRQLYLQNNKLMEILPNTFSNLPRLERLFLHNNQLKKIPAAAFENIGSMTRLRLDSNDLVCDCDLLWLVERLRDKPTEMAAICQSPEEMQGKSLTTMTIHDFHCKTPKILQGPGDVEVQEGETAYFTCRVDGDPKPAVKWMRNSDQVNVDGKKYILKQDGTLVIPRVTVDDIGEYECIAESKMGAEVSRKARAVITVSPAIRFTQLPSSQTVTAGEDISFTCKADSQMPVTLEWWKDGQRIYSDNQRIYLQDQSSILRILSATPRDSARYVCQARNANGFAEVSADLRVLEKNSSPPKLIYEPPKNLDSEVGATVEIPCRAAGEPKPVIQWKKDGSALEPRVSSIKISRGGSLYIQNISLADSGRYECTAVNNNGRVTAQCLLQVHPVLGSSNTISNSIGSTSDTLIRRAFNDATETIDRAINQTLESLFGVKNDAKEPRHFDPFRVTRFPNAVARAAARPAEIFERTLLNIRRFMDKGMSVNSSTPFKYEDILTSEQIAEIERLSGCTGHRKKHTCNNLCFHTKYRSIDGSCNNLKHPTWGSSYTGFRRILQPIYENGFSQPIGWDPSRLYYGFKKPPARLVSTKLISTTKISSDSRITHMVMQWGQFLDHDLDHALPAVSSESWDGIDCKKSCENAAPCFPMQVPPGDPRISNRRCIDFIRTSAVCGSGMTSILWGQGIMLREQMNQLTSYLDASQVYGYNDDLALDLRDMTPSRSLNNDADRNDNRGLLREGVTLPGKKPLLPYSTPGQFVDCRRNPIESTINCFVAGDIRANEQVGLLAMHTLWLREHNRIAQILGELNPHWSGERLYQESRKIVGAEMQHITYQHWLPIIFGQTTEELIGTWTGYNPELDASISNVFATAALRFGHSIIQPRLERLNEDLSSIPQGPLNLRDAFFSPWRLVDEGGVDPLLRGMFATAAKLKMPEENLNTELTEQLFRTAHAVALDLAAMNIQRAREHGIPGYLEWRKFCNFSHEFDSFDELANEISNAKVRRKLQELYGHPGNIDVWVGGILEDQLPGAKVGPLFKCLLLEQFKRTRDADRLWYENPSTFKPEQLQQIKQTSLARILCDNGDNITRIQKNVFVLPETDGEKMVSCQDIPAVDLRFWSQCCGDLDSTCTSVNGNLPRVRLPRSPTAEKYLEVFNTHQQLVDGNYYDNSKDKVVMMVEHVKEEARILNKLVNKISKRVDELKEFIKSTNNTIDSWMAGDLI